MRRPQNNPVRLMSFALPRDEVYTKSSADLISALVHYIKPPTMDMSEHLTAHLAKEKDIIRRRTVKVSAEDIHGAMYGSSEVSCNHTAG